MTIKISIVIPSYNYGRFIGETIDSILAQDYPNTEIIVIDGGSTDNTVEVVQSYGDKIAYFVSEPDEGQSNALNKGFALTTGDVMAWICSDDIYLPGAFKRAADFFEQHRDCAFLYGDGAIIDGDSNWVCDIKSGPVLDRNTFHNYNYVFSTTSFWRRSLWEKSGAHIDESNNWTMDWELFIRMNQVAELHYRPGNVACLRHHEEAKTYTGRNQFTAKRDREIVGVSRRYGGWFCYNSLMFVCLEISRLARHFEGLPKPLYSLAFRLCHVPMQMMPSKTLSVFFNGPRVRSEN
ncbi:glycosyltransferase family 2 protein [uncultured Pelagimonas sp.]|uniref:glycosyltransferase family 2 protein n=1 Tax=uncultured Pelagimonas sp. TaxID=1618102 RepID=UPI00260FCB9E|nr:glycosyltransferase family 2 protein [uncultured Pelagimonas sp.]